MAERLSDDELSRLEFQCCPDIKNDQRTLRLIAEVRELRAEVERLKPKPPLEFKTLTTAEWDERDSNDAKEFCTYLNDELGIRASVGIHVMREALFAICAHKSDMPQVPKVWGRWVIIAKHYTDAEEPTP